MKSRVIFLLLTLLSSLVFATPVAAQTPIPDCTGVTIQPQSIYSSVSPTSIIITRAGFSMTTTVVMSTVGVLTSTFSAPDVLTVTIPAGVPAGTYSLTFLDAGVTIANCPNALAILAAPDTGVPSSTPATTHTPAPTNFVRPVIAVDTYGASSPAITPGEDLDFDLTFVNWGQITATNIIATFPAGDFSPRATGGQRVVGSLDPGAKVKVYQPLTAATALAGKNVATLEVKVTYTDPAGTAYNESFTITLPVVRAVGGAARTPTATGTLTPRPQLLVRGYKTDPSPLQPGQRFSLTLEVLNAGATAAKRITMILGGGTASGTSGSGSGGTSGTPGAGSGGAGGGVSGGGADVSNFAPIESSNVQFIGDIQSAGSISLTQKLIVNATTKAGAYPMKLSFAYTDEAGNNFNDDQVITLLVYVPPLLEVSFYRPPDPMMGGQPGPLPVQVVNKSRSSILLGNMVVTAEGAEMSNNTILVGALDPGNSFPLDAIMIPSQPGTVEITVTIDYVDDFNQPQVITETLTVEVMEAPVFEPGGPDGPGGSEPPPPEPESWWQTIVRFFAGLLGLNSAPSTDTGGGRGDVIQSGGEAPPPGVAVTVAPVK